MMDDDVSVSKHLKLRISVFSLAQNELLTCAQGGSAATDLKHDVQQDKPQVLLHTPKSCSLH